MAGIGNIVFGVVIVAIGAMVLNMERDIYD